MTEFIVTSITLREIVESLRRKAETASDAGARSALRAAAETIDGVIKATEKRTEIDHTSDPFHSNSV